MAKEFSYEWLKEELEILQEEQAQLDKKNILANMVPFIFITEGDRVDTFTLEAGGKWSKDKYPRELLPAIRAYRAELLKAVREAEWYIQFLQEEGSYPLGKIEVNITYKEKAE